MRFTIQIIVTLLFGFVLELVLPWWSIAIAAFMAGLFVNSRFSFVAGFLSIALLWAIKALMIENAAAADLSSRVAAIFSIPTPLLFVVTSVIGGIVGGFAATTGTTLRKKKKRRNYY